MRRSLAIIVPAVWLLNLFAATSCGQESSSSRDRFLAEAPLKWAEYRQRAKILQGSFVWTTKDYTAGGRVNYHQRIEFRQNPACASVLAQHLEKENKQGTIDVLNSRYAFELRRANVDGAWAIVQTDLDLSDGVSVGPTPPDFYVRAIVDKVFTFSSVYECLPELMKDPDFKIEGVTTVQQGDTQFVRLDFTSVPKETSPLKINNNVVSGGWSSLRKGWVLLDPRRYWVISRLEALGEFAGGHTETMAGSFEYVEGEGGFPILRRRLLRAFKGMSIEESRLVSEDINEFELVEQANIAESEFTLSAFGFPEPAGLRQPTRWYLWAAGLGIICLSVGVLLHWRARRRKTSAGAAAVADKF